MAQDYVGPADGKHFLPQSEILIRLTKAFGIHDVDAMKGQASADTMIAKLEDLKAPSEIVESYSNRRQHAVNCYLSDDGSENGYLSFTLWPDEPIFIGYHSAHHEAAARPLLERLASILGYVIQSQEDLDEQ